MTDPIYGVLSSRKSPRGARKVLSRPNDSERTSTGDRDGVAKGAKAIPGNETTKGKSAGQSKTAPSKDSVLLAPASKFKLKTKPKLLTRDQRRKLKAKVINDRTVNTVSILLSLLLGRAIKWGRTRVENFNEEKWKKNRMAILIASLVAKFTSEN
ncbi:hypothetical protein HD806DRAFT_527635 [Xylariaceae sp. AK1471]|nr:hypothetical protein HD806DRAFT_527635 [Xylariaceae sp. AK1471]